MDNMTVNIQIPRDLPFSALRLGRDSQTFDVTFDWLAVEKVCAESGIDFGLFKNNPDNLAMLLSTWYARHLQAGGVRDVVMDDLLMEKSFAARRGEIAHSPGRC
jgi:hypothetical protein